ncbi:MAG: sigma-70 family RNA polymerase sigma factor [Ferrimicrobium sp.]
MSRKPTSSAKDEGFNGYGSGASDPPLLRREDEIRLSTVIQRLSAKGSELTGEELVELKEAKDIFVRSNLRLVVALARRLSRPGIPIEDLIQEGNIGLMRAVDLFDGRKGFRFSTYAAWWIRQGILQALATYRGGLNIPRTIQQELAALRRAERDLVQKLGRQPRLSEVAASAGIEELRARELESYAQGVLSLEASVGQGDGDYEATLGDFVPDTVSLGIEGTIVRQDLVRVISQAIEHLELREQQILRFRFGLDGTEGHSVEEAAAEFGVSRERVRQVEARAISRLRRNEASEILRDVMRD